MLLETKYIVVLCVCLSAPAPSEQLVNYRRGGGSAGMIVAKQSTSSVINHTERLEVWIKPEQVFVVSGIWMQVPIVRSGHLIQSIKQASSDHSLPTIPHQMRTMNFTWSGGRHRNYDYEFSSMLSNNLLILENPVVSVPAQGRIPRRTSEFSIELPCTGRVSGETLFTVGLDIRQRKRRNHVPGFPFILQLVKQCSAENDREITETTARCQNGSMCPLITACFPACQHGGVCEPPGKCRCVNGFQGPRCEGGICRKRCENGGKCVQKDVCQCGRGFYGTRCQFSKCVIPCQNGGVCAGINRCRCRRGFSGRHCQLANKSQMSRVAPKMPQKRRKTRSRVSNT